MLLIHKSQSRKKLFFLVITSICSIGALLGLSALTYTPELSHADSINSNETRSLADITYMQEMNPQICANSPLNTQFTLTDSRDGETYTVARIKNQTNSEAYCWMTQNLRLTDHNLTPADSDVSESYVLPASTTLSADDNPAQFSEADVYESKVYYDPSHPEYGAYYNWYTATASTGNATLSTKGENAPSSVCPSGWHLPTGGANGDFYSLLNGQNISVIEGDPYFLSKTGDIYDSVLQVNGSNGHLWSSTAAREGMAYILNFNTTINHSNYNYRWYGQPIRCIATTNPQTTLSDATYMQELTSGMCERSTENESKQLIDTRDGKSYWVTKLKDGNCWMTQNLDLDIPVEGLKAEDTDITEDWNSNSAYPPRATQVTAEPSGFGEGSIIASWDPALGGAATHCNDGTVAGKCKQNGNPVTSVNNNHDAQGNYYNWPAATAGRFTSLVNVGGEEQSTQSICPKGWRLPLSGINNDATSGSFYNLLNQYGLASSVSNSATDYSVYTTPLYFVYGGVIRTNTIDDAGNEGNYWSSVVKDKNNPYVLGFLTSVNPSGTWNYARGLSVRCVLRDNIPDYNNNVTIAVNPTISLDVADEVTVEKSETNPSTAGLDVKVTSNQKYSVGISATDSNLTSTTSEVKIPAKSGLLNTTENGWGIKLKDNTNYTALTTSLQTFYTASGAEIKTIPFTIGISTAPNIPNGEYSTDITVTATQN